MASQWADLLQVYIKELVAIIHLDGVITEFTVADKFDFYCIFSEKKKKQTILSVKWSREKVSGYGKQANIYLKTFKVAPKSRDLW